MKKLLSLLLCTIIAFTCCSTSALSAAKLTEEGRAFAERYLKKHGYNVSSSSKTEDVNKEKVVYSPKSFTLSPEEQKKLKPLETKKTSNDVQNHPVTSNDANNVLTIGEIFYFLLMGILECWLGYLLLIIALIKKSDGFFLSGLIIQLICCFTNIHIVGKTVFTIVPLVLFIFVAGLIFIHITNEKEKQKQEQ